MSLLSPLLISLPASTESMIVNGIVSPASGLEARPQGEGGRVTLAAAVVSYLAGTCYTSATAARDEFATAHSCPRVNRALPSDSTFSFTHQEARRIAARTTSLETAAARRRSLS